jgi:hypothetical protein
METSGWVTGHNSGWEADPTNQGKLSWCSMNTVWGPDREPRDSLGRQIHRIFVWGRLYQPQNTDTPMIYRHSSLESSPRKWSPCGQDARRQSHMSGYMKAQAMAINLSLMTRHHSTCVLCCLVPYFSLPVSYKETIYWWVIQVSGVCKVAPTSPLEGI